MKETGKTKIIVFSDSHGSSVNMLKIAGLYRYSADYFIFLGDGLGSAARERSADIVLFGHTHLPYEAYIASDSEEEKSVWLFNPGSMSKPREGKPSYGIIDIFVRSGKRSVLLSHGTTD